MALVGFGIKAMEGGDCKPNFDESNASYLWLGRINRPVGVADAGARTMVASLGQLHDGLIDAVDVLGVGERVLPFDQFLREVAVYPRSVPCSCSCHDASPVYRFDGPTINYGECRRNQKRKKSRGHGIAESFETEKTRAFGLTSYCGSCGLLPSTPIYLSYKHVRVTPGGDCADGSGSPGSDSVLGVECERRESPCRFPGCHPEHLQS